MHVYSCPSMDEDCLVAYMGLCPTLSAVAAHQGRLQEAECKPALCSICCQLVLSIRPGKSSDVSQPDTGCPLD